jgi:hypothetical protein
MTVVFPLPRNPVKTVQGMESDIPENRRKFSFLLPFFVNFPTNDILSIPNYLTPNPGIYFVFGQTDPSLMLNQHLLECRDLLLLNKPAALLPFYQFK